MQAPATIATAVLAAVASRGEQANAIESAAMSARMNVIAVVAASPQAQSKVAPKPGSEMQIAHTEPISLVTLADLRPLAARAAHPRVEAATQLVLLVPLSIGDAPPQKLREDGVVWAVAFPLGACCAEWP